MTKIKLCGLTRISDIEAANRIMPDYVGFVFASKSKRRVSPETAMQLKQALSPQIKAVGVFVNESVESVAKLLKCGIIDIAQLHGDENEEYISRLRRLSERPLIKAFRVKSPADIRAAENCTSDYVLMDSGAGTGRTFNWTLLKGMSKPYFLAGGLDPDNIADAIKQLNPYAVDVSSGIETDGTKDETKMAAFAAAVRKDEGI